MSSADVVVIGGGIVGTSAAALLAQAGLRVVLVEADEIAAGASGRNSGSLQHPFHPLLGRLHESSLRLYRELSEAEPGFRLPDRSDGLILVTHDGAGLAARAAVVREAVPELAPEILDPDDLQRVQPALADGTWGLQLATGIPLRPTAATHAYAELARRRGAEVIVGEPALPIAADAPAVRLASGRHIDCGRVLVAAGPWTAALVPDWDTPPPIVPSWGVVVSVELAAPPSAILEEIGIDSAGSPEALAFSLVTADGATSVGSTFLAERPDANDMAWRILERGRRFVPALGSSQVRGVRTCARPVSRDGLPYVGPIAGSAHLFVCAGHGPWGISTGPGSAELVVDLMLGRPAEPELAAAVSPARVAAAASPPRDTQAGTAAG